jgi:hypothetical protein
MFFRGQTARAIESALTEGCCRVQRTMPADLPPTAGYLAMNSDPLGIPAEKAEQASWRVNEAHRFTVEPGFVLLATVPAPPDRPGGWSMPRKGLFYFHTPSPVPPQPAGSLDGVELHAISQTRQFVGPVGWAWCFGIDTKKHRAYLRATS